METKLSKRLETVAAYVPQGSRLCDVGSDHAYLPLYLLEKGQIDFAIAGEVVAGPYQSAVKNVEQAGQAKKITVRLADGLAAMESSDAIDIVTIAGMGGRLIADILEAGIDKLQTVKRLVLQPNNREDQLRQWLTTNNFKIVDEAIMTENQKIYEIIVAEAGQMTLSAKDERFGPYLAQEKSAVFIQKWQKELNKLKIALEQVPQERSESRKQLEDKIIAIKEVLDVS